MKKLIIVESPHKAKTIQKYLGQDYVVMASSGHICDLPQKTLGIDVEHRFQPQYEINQDKKDIIKNTRTINFTYSFYFTNIVGKCCKINARV